MGRPRISIPPGTRFGMLVTTGSFSIGGQQMRYSCVCDCGNKTEPYASRLLKGYVNSCGCSRVRQSERYWTEARIKVVLEMAEHSTPGEIARALGISAMAVQSKMVSMGVYRYKEHTPPVRLSPVRFPMFEDITREEARAAMAGAPKSAAFRVHGVERFSGMGCSAGMCAGWR